MDLVTLFTIGITYIQLSAGLPWPPTAATSTTTAIPPTNVNSTAACPRFLTRNVYDSLIIHYQPSNEHCEMLVTVHIVKLRPTTPVKAFGEKHKTIRRAIVSFRNTSTQLEVPCDPLPYRSLGPFVFVDTRKNECQLLLRVHRMQNPNYKPRKSNGKKKGRDGKKSRIPKYFFIPKYEYLDEVLF